MEYEMNPYIVYIKTNSSGYITAANSSAFLVDNTGWTKIDEGHGDKYHHAQGNYFPESVMTMGGAYRYKLVDGEVVECTVEEIEAQEVANQPNAAPALETRVGTLETDSAEMKEALDMILSGVTE